MPINVTCPSCFTRFTVNDKFAGKSGPCPKCKSTIKIPEKSEEVVIHAPKDDIPKDSKGKSIIAPIRREEVKLGLPVILAASLGTVAALGVALGLRLSQTPPAAALVVLGALFLAVPLVVAGYWFLQTDDLQGYKGKELWVRAGICGLVFALTWAVYVFVPVIIGSHATVAETTPIEMLVLVAVMIGLGTVAAVLALEMEVAQGVMLFMLYFIVSFFLAWLAGAPLGEFLPGTAKPAAATPGAIQPANPLPSETTEPKRPPNLLQ